MVPSYKLSCLLQIDKTENDLIVPSNLSKSVEKEKVRFSSSYLVPILPGNLKSQMNCQFASDFQKIKKIKIKVHHNNRNPNYATVAYTFNYS